LISASRLAMVAAQTTKPALGHSLNMGRIQHRCRLCKLYFSRPTNKLTAGCRGEPEHGREMHTLYPGRIADANVLEVQSSKAMADNSIHTVQGFLAESAQRELRAAEAQSWWSLTFCAKPAARAASAICSASFRIAGQNCRKMLPYPA
jgi:hypothetical protein